GAAVAVVLSNTVLSVNATLAVELTWSVMVVAFGPSSMFHAPVSAPCADASDKAVTAVAANNIMLIPCVSVLFLIRCLQNQRMSLRSRHAGAIITRSIPRSYHEN